MKAARPRLDHPVLRGLASARLSIALLTGLIALSMVAVLLPQRSSSPVPLARIYSPETLDLLDSLGLIQVFGSGWFVFILSLLILNLVTAAILRLPVVWRQAQVHHPPPVDLAKLAGAKRHERYFYIDLRSSIGREDFREMVTKWSRRNIGRPRVLRDEGGLNELQLASQEGRFSRVLMYVAHVGLVVLITGGVITALYGFEGQVTIDDGGRVDFLQVARGKPRRWPVLMENGREIPGFYRPGFELENKRVEVVLHPGSEKARSVKTWLDVREKGQVVASLTVSVNRPARYKGLAIHQTGYSHSGRLGATFTVHDRDGEDAQKHDRAAKGDEFQVGGGKVKILQVREAVDELGASMQLEFTPAADQPPEQFWIFENYPGFDPVHRKRSRYTFVIHSVEPLYGSTLRFSRDPGAPVALAGAILLVLGLISSMVTSHNRYWFLWNPGRVTVVGWSKQHFLFEPRFERAMEKFKARLGRLDKTVKTMKLEIRHGSL